MPTLYVARSQSFEKWAAEVGLTKHVLKVGVAEGDPAEAVEALNAQSYAGSNDWKVLKKRAAEDIEESAIIERLARRENMVDPNTIRVCAARPASTRSSSPMCRTSSWSTRRSMARRPRSPRSGRPRWPTIC